MYAGDLVPANRDSCGDATTPLLDAVDSLVTYASSPEFASVPAKISAQAKAAQYPLIMSGMLRLLVDVLYQDFDNPSCV